jgi:glucitol/sorbitol PTS system EIIB component
MADYKAVTIEKGRGGWGGPLTIKPTAERNLIYSVTGGGIHPVAARIAELTGGEAFDGFRSSAPFNKIACAVIDCGGTARVGVYPMKKVPTVDVHPTSPAGPLAMFITEELFVSGVKPENVREVVSR